MDRLTIAGDAVLGVSGAYEPEAGVEPLPDGHHVVPSRAGKAPTREFERD